MSSTPIKIFSVNSISDSKSALIWPVSAPGSNCNLRDILYIPEIEIFVFLDLDQISVDFEMKHFSKVSGRIPYRSIKM